MRPDFPSNRMGRRNEQIAFGVTYPTGSVPRMVE